MATEFDADKFKARYGLTDADFEVMRLNGETYVRLADGVKLPDDTPIFEAPDPLPPLKTIRMYAQELVDELFPNASVERKDRILAILRRLVGDVPPERQA